MKWLKELVKREGPRPERELTICELLKTRERRRRSREHRKISHDLSHADLGGLSINQWHRFTQWSMSS